MIDQKSSVVNPILSESESHEFVLDQSLAEKLVNLTLPSVHHTFRIESKPHTAKFLLVSSISNELEGNPPIPKVHERSSSFPIEQWGNSRVPTTPPPSSLVTSFDYSQLSGYRLPSYVSFQITLQAYHMDIPSTLIDKGAYVSILSSTAWQALGYPQLIPVTQNMLAFNRGTSQPLGILPKFPITLGGKIVYIDMMVVQGPLDFNLILVHDYVYVMGAPVSSLFQVMCFAHDGSIVIIDHLIFIGPESTPHQPSSLNGSLI